MSLNDAGTFTNERINALSICTRSTVRENIRRDRIFSTDDHLSGCTCSPQRRRQLLKKAPGSLATTRVTKTEQLLHIVLQNEDHMLRWTHTEYQLKLPKQRHMEAPKKSQEKKGKGREMGTQIKYWRTQDRLFAEIRSESINGKLPTYTVRIIKCGYYLLHLWKMGYL